MKETREQKIEVFRQYVINCGYAKSFVDFMVDQYIHKLDMEEKENKNAVA